MSNESFLLLAIGVFLSLIIAVASFDRFQRDEHPTSEVSGLIWRVENALLRAQDVQAVIKVTHNMVPQPSSRMVVQVVNRPLPALALTYLEPASLKDQVFTVQNDLLSHYVPGEKMIVIKRWVGLPLAALGLSGLDLSQIERDWEAGILDVQVVQSLPGFETAGLQAPITVDLSLVDGRSSTTFSLVPQIDDDTEPATHLTLAGDPAVGNSIRGEYILEVRSARTGDLSRIVWIERETFHIQKIVFFTDDGERERTIQIEDFSVNQGLTPEMILFVPNSGDFEIVRG